jgi:hypothetical protein
MTFFRAADLRRGHRGRDESLGVGRPAVGRRDPGPPLEELLAGVVPVHNHLDEAEAVLGARGRRDRLLELLLRPDLHGPALAVGVVDRVDQARVVPVLDGVVRAVADLHLDGVPAIVDEEDDAVLAAPQHRRHVLRRHLFDERAMCQHE